ncbi:uncharacterized protein LOC134774742 [Penaeus indicus]|uniref:uncharacterized protein LOC134774742 n=1 Tax=Penaeus indicus TaxID=29960 RepID=UPI00300D347D
MFFWQGKNFDEPRQYGVGFTMRKSLLNTVEPGSNGSERLLTLLLNTTAGPVTLVSVYAPTLTATLDVKDEFYDKLAATINSIPSKEQLVLLEDFNARVGADHNTWPTCLGQFGVGKMNNGQRLLELWQTPAQGLLEHWYQLDLILVRRTAIKNVLQTYSYHSIDCDKPLIGVLQDQVPAQEVPPRQEAREPSDRYQQDEPARPCGAVCCEVREQITPVIDAKRAALAEYKQSPSERNLQILRATRSKAQQTARHCANEYWTELSVNIQTAAITGNIRGMYDGIKMAMGPVQNKTAPLKSTIGEIITDKGQQMERWVEHYSELYSRQNVTSAALDAIKGLPVLEELDTEPIIEDLSKTIDSLASGKAPGSDGIPPDLIKHCKTTLLLPLYEVLCQCWNEGAIPQDMRDAKIVTLYKNKGERNDCNNYRGISLLSIVGKVFTRVILARLQKFTERVYPES